MHKRLCSFLDTYEILYPLKTLHYQKNIQKVDISIFLSQNWSTMGIEVMFYVGSNPTFLEDLNMCL